MAGLRSLFIKHVAQTSPYPLGLDILSAQGMYIYTRDGRRYLDFNSGISVSALGHCHPEVVQAVTTQVSTYMHTMVYGEHIQEPQVMYGALLSSVLGGHFESIYFVNSGSEAVEAAIKLVRKITHRPHIIAASKAYHGSTLGAESLRSDTDYIRSFAPSVPGISHIRFNAFDDLTAINDRTAAVIIEPIQAESGIVLPQPFYLQRLAERCREVGALLVFDEIQTGFGRTGRLFAFQKYGVVPDLLLIAKGMGGGMPIGGLVSSKAFLDHFSQNPVLGHITTFGGHPVCVAAALATLRTLMDTDIIQSVEDKSRYIIHHLRHPLIKSIHGEGLMLAVHVHNASYLAVLIEEIIRHGVLVDFFLFNDSAFRIAPPLILTYDDIDVGISLILKACDIVMRKI